MTDTPHRRTRANGGRVAVLTFGLTLFGAGSPPGHLLAQVQGDSTKMFQTGRPECPHDWGEHLMRKAKMTQREEPRTVDPSGRPSLALATSDIPEFSDCQRFVLVEPGPMGGKLYKYDSLYAVLVDTNLTSRYLSIPKPGSDAYGHTGVAIALIEILTESGTYAPLGIKPDFNCVYFYYDTSTHLRAKLVAIGPYEKDCRVPARPDTLVGDNVTELEVRYSHPNKTASAPAVARWDWDGARAEQYFGFGCGDGWCEVGRSGFTSSVVPEGPTNVAANRPAGWEPMASTKGWFDVQWLAVPIVPPANEAPKPPRPTTLNGAVFPDPALNLLTTREHFSKWKRAAFVAFDGAGQAPEKGGYKTKVNFDAGSSSNTTLNEVHFCYGTWVECYRNGTDASADQRLRVPAGRPVPSEPKCLSPDVSGVEQRDKGMWWAAIISAKFGHVSYRCVKRRGHEAGLNIPATARWRYRDADDVIWVWCSSGCCELDA